MAERIRAFDWDSHPLGPPKSWPQSLKVVVRIMLTSRYAMWLGWGPEFFFFCNDAYLPTVGIKRDWVLGASARKVWAEIWPDIGPRAESVVRTGQATWDESLLLFLERSGYAEETYHTFSYSPVPDDAGAVGGMLCVVTEETERVLGERRLALLRELAADLAGINTKPQLCKAIEYRLGARAQDLPFALLYLFDSKGDEARLVCAHGTAPGSAIAPSSMRLDSDREVWPARAVFDGVARHQVVDCLQDRFSEVPKGPWDRGCRQAVVFPIAQQGQDRSAGFLVAGINPYRPFDGNYDGFVNLLAGQIASALSNVRAYEEERKRAEALAEIDRAKTVFFSNVSHELRTPLTLLLGPVEDLLKAPESSIKPECRELAAVAHRNSLRLLKLVNTLLDFSRIEAGRVRAFYQATDLATFTEDLASTFRSAIEKAGLRLVIDCPPLRQPVYVDRDMWEKIVLNLISNAFKFTLEGEIRISLRESGESVRFSVMDTGTGIPAEAQKQVFERFFRVAGAKGRSYEGTGIGLALVQELVKLHGGTAQLESEPGKGSTFTVTIHHGTAYLPKDHISADNAAVSTSLGPAPFIEESLRWMPEEVEEKDNRDIAAKWAVDDIPQDPALRAKVLLADDNADMRSYVTRLLASRFDVVAVPDGRAALTAAAEQKPDLILSDVMMPELDGFGLLKALRQNPELHTIPVILLSARAGEEARVEGVEAGADDYLIKPFSARELLARVATHLDLARVRREAARQISISESRMREARDELAAQLEDLRRLHEIGARFEAIVQSSDDAIISKDLRGTIKTWNQGAERIFGYTAKEAIGKPVTILIPPDRQSEEQEILDQIGRGRHIDHYETVRVRKDGTLVDISLSVSPIKDTDGKVLGASKIARDITEPKQTQEMLRRQKWRLEIVNRIGNTLAGELDLNKLVQAVTDAGREISGAAFGAFFYNVKNERGESYTLYTLSGAPREAFSKFPMPRNTLVFDPTFRGEGVIRVGDILKDPRYGKMAPYHGMPPGHLPVRSYLAVPVVSRSHEVLGGLFFGHPEPNVFTEESEDVLVAIAAQASVAIDNANLYQVIQRELIGHKRAEEALRESRERLHASLEAAGTGTFRWNIQTDTLDADESLNRLFGFPPDRPGQSLAEFVEKVHPEDRAGVLAACRRCSQEGADFDSEFRVIWPDGSVHWLDDKGKTFVDERGRPAYMIGACVDVTKRRQSEALVRHQKDVLEQIVQGDSLPDILELLTVSVQQLADRHLIATILSLEPDGRRLRALAGRNCPVDWTRYVDNLEIGPEAGSCGTAAYRGERVITADIASDPLWRLHKDEALKHGLRACWSTPIISSSGKVLGTFAVYYTEPTIPTEGEVELVDIMTRTAAIAIERKQSEQALKESKAKLENHAQDLERHVVERTAKLRETITDLEAFSYSISHDMRAPLRAMQGFSEALVRDHAEKLDGEGKDFLQRIHRAAQRLDLLIRDVLAYSKVAKGDLVLRPVSLDQAVPEIVESYPELEAAKPNITIEGPLHTVWAHEAFLSQIVSNLIGNALKFVGPGVVPRMRIRADLQRDMVRLWFEDNGLGIAPEHYSRIFQIFGRVYPDKKFEGTGIGLAVVKKAVERMNGEIGVESTLGQGSRFWILLRRAG